MIKRHLGMQGQDKSAALVSAFLGQATQGHGDHDGKRDEDKAAGKNGVAHRVLKHWEFNARAALVALAIQAVRDVLIRGAMVVGAVLLAWKLIVFGPFFQGANGGGAKVHHAPALGAVEVRAKAGRQLGPGQPGTSLGKTGHKGKPQGQHGGDIFPEGPRGLGGEGARGGHP